LIRPHEYQPDDDIIFFIVVVVVIAAIVVVVVIVFDVVVVAVSDLVLLTMKLCSIYECDHDVIGCWTVLNVNFYC